MRVLDDPLPELLEAFIEGPGTLSTRFSNDGISHISGSYNNEIRHESIMISLDTAKGYRLVSWKNKMGYPKEPKRNNNTTCQIEWGCACQPPVGPLRIPNSHLRRAQNQILKSLLPQFFFRHPRYDTPKIII